MRDIMVCHIVYSHHAQPVFGYLGQAEFLRQVHKTVDVFTENVLICIYDSCFTNGANCQAWVRRDYL